MSFCLNNPSLFRTKITLITRIISVASSKLQNLGVWRNGLSAPMELSDSNFIYKATGGLGILERSCLLIVLVAHLVKNYRSKVVKRFSERTSDSCNVKLPIKSVKIKILIHS